MKDNSKKVIIHLTIILFLLSGLLIYNMSFISDIYIDRQATSLGIFLNGIIILLFIFGIVSLYTALLHYLFEEKQVELFIKGKLERRENVPFLSNLSVNSIIYKRYFKIKDLYDKNIPINHGTLTSIMMAEESQFLSFPKFVNNVLILLGVFGTVISLIIALTGASAILNSETQATGTGLILHGMNTALTTTATAITCYFIFTYFFHKLADLQTFMFGKIEDTVLVYIIPEFVFNIEKVNYEVEKMIKKQTELFGEIKSFSKSMTEGIHVIKETVSSQLDQVNSFLLKEDSRIEGANNLEKTLNEIKEILKNGFRLR